MKNLTLEEFAKKFAEADAIFETSEVEASIWCKYYYPTTIIADRYDGTYSNAEWLAFPCLLEQVPKEVDGEDGECMFFWNNYKKIVGKGKTPQEAFDNLKELMTAKNI